MRAKVFFIGSGDRIKNNFIPAFNFLSKRFTLFGLYSPTKTHRASVCNQWNIPEVSTLDSKKIREADIVVISISTRSVPEVLLAISQTCKGKILVIDTPVFATLKDFCAAKLLSNFAKVFVAEDYIHFPQFRLIRKVLNEGKIGTFQRAVMCHIGYKYHGLALARSFVGLERPQNIMRECLDDKINTTLKFSGSYVKIIDPYKRKGWIELQGSAGKLVYDSSKTYNGDSDFVLTHDSQENGNVIFSINGEPFLSEDQPAPYAFLKSLPIENTSDFNIFKTCGLIDVLKGIYQKTDNTYTLQDALYDSAISRIVWRQKTLPAWLGKALVWGSKLL
tara:strand:+ start:270 stop:1271 length:1002 start_codon:yes stop_codon:yes gene_type:complete